MSETRLPPNFEAFPEGSVVSDDNPRKPGTHQLTRHNDHEQPPSYCPCGAPSSPSCLPGSSPAKKLR